MNALRYGFVVPALVSLFACSGNVDNSAPATESSAIALTSADSAAAVLGTWAFVLDASDVAAQVRERCDRESGGDRSRADACYADVRTEGASEKIRLATDSAGHSVWTSFGEKGGKVQVFLETPMDLSSESPTRVVGKVTGAPKGAQAESAASHMPLGTLIPFEVVDGHTIAMLDPAKGRLVFRRE